MGRPRKVNTRKSIAKNGENSVKKGRKKAVKKQVSPVPSQTGADSKKEVKRSSEGKLEEPEPLNFVNEPASEEYDDSQSTIDPPGPYGFYRSDMNTAVVGTTVTGVKRNIQRQPVYDVADQNNNEIYNEETWADVW